MLFALILPSTSWGVLMQISPNSLQVVPYGKLTCLGSANVWSATQPRLKLPLLLVALTYPVLSVGLRGASTSIPVTPAIPTYGALVLPVEAHGHITLPHPSSG